MMHYEQVFLIPYHHRHLKIRPFSRSSGSEKETRRHTVSNAFWIIDKSLWRNLRTNEKVYENNLVKKYIRFSVGFNEKEKMSFLRLYLDFGARPVGTWATRIKSERNLSEINKFWLIPFITTKVNSELNETWGGTHTHTPTFSRTWTLERAHAFELR